MLRITQLVLLVFCALNQVDSEDPVQIFITVYYESKCPDSKYFIIGQLQPTVNLLHEYIKLKLVPFGKATSLNNGHHAFQCQHGPSECAGNMVQSCALDLMERRSDLEKVSYVACEMQSQAGTRGDMECVLRAGVPVDKVQNCVNTGKGISLQFEDEYLTNQVSPEFIPTITIDEEFDQQVQDSSLQDLTGTLCSIFNNIPPCLKYNNNRL